MAIQRYNKYQYETSPKKLQPIEKPKNKKYPKTKKKQNVNLNKAKKINKENKMKVKLVMSLVIAFVILLAISYRNSLINESFSEKQNLQKQLAALEKENKQMEIGIENSLNLKNIQRDAETLLGMQKATNKQIIYISLPKKDYIETATEEIKVEEDTNWFNKIINKIKNIF